MCDLWMAVCVHCHACLTGGRVLPCMCALARRILHNTLCKPLPTRNALRMNAWAAQPEEVWQVH